jgi:hypothetical protein
MIADNTEGPIETFLKLVTAPMWLPLYFGYLGCLKLAEVWAKKAKLETTDVSPAWTPATEMERAVYAALILAGEPVNNRRLAELMDCSPGEASKRVTRLEGVVRKVREGREVMIGLH